MGGLQDEMFGAVYEKDFLLRVAAPEEEDSVGAMFACKADDSISETFPAVARVRVSMPLAHCECGIE